jgi:hypothetical protein
MYIVYMHFGWTRALSQFVFDPFITFTCRKYFLGNQCEQYGGSRREEELEDTKGVIIISKSKDTQHNYLA